jgi:hypothetical protein
VFVSRWVCLTLSVCVCVCDRTAPSKTLTAVSPSSKGPNLQRGTQARNTFHGKDARRQVQTPYNGPGAAPSHTVDTSAMGPGAGRPSFFNRITQKFSRRSALHPSSSSVPPSKISLSPTHRVFLSVTTTVQGSLSLLLLFATCSLCGRHSAVFGMFSHWGCTVCPQTRPCCITIAALSVCRLAVNKQRPIIWLPSSLPYC